ncbi:MAG: hypothetical protein G01um101418_872 [Parcubacteria group bacterium Gr01-1014_18]|nr:MAG: hypothetical protein Greene041636_832 [Parcubacteria group bacterium Greene0416_36]TSC79873.1 MAG: hypothetical protein G01um101418_872 [Parcubacteria group bacterium Gr01-1014_18]TSC98305.1 MAG: hypothetical protein Greene101420_809 [Parcubacteria group bacterium Greene1014_20]TSD06654.1 MAG: hypothetical protein Greene07142_706 [Parcubacteria group bacterium Greene0714_2]
MKTTNPPQSPFDKGEAVTPSLVKGRVGEGFVAGVFMKKEIYISVDVETTGAIPSKYSMYQLGASVVGDSSRNFFKEIQLISHDFEPDALKAVGITLEELKILGVAPKVAMAEFEAWIKEVSGDGQPVFVGFNAPFDWSFVNGYFHLFLGHNPFGWDALDIKSYYMGMQKCSWMGTKKGKLLPQFQSTKKHTHNALQDAIEQAEIFEKMMKLV